MSYIDTEDFAKRFVELIKFTHPTLPIVQAFQNVTQPVNILNGEALMVFDIERIVKTGTDYVLGNSADIALWGEQPWGFDNWGLTENTTVFAGDRLVQVNIELFDANALSVMSNLRDIWETYSYRDKQRELGFMEERQDTPPFNSTRKHSKEKFVTSARYLTRFHMSVAYTAGDNEVTQITNGTITGVADTLTQEKTIITNFSK